MNSLRFSKKLKKGVIYFILLFVNLWNLSAQEQTDSGATGNKYILGGVNVKGDISYNPQTVITFSGLQEGQELWVPGEEITNAIKKLWKLGLFDDVNIYVNEIKGDSIFLDLHINELPKLLEVKINGLNKSKTEALLKDLKLTKGKIVNENLLRTTKNYVENKYKKDGYYNTKVNINTIKDTADFRLVKMLINVDRGKKTKIKELEIEGNQQLTDSELRRAMKGTKKRNFIRVYKASKFIPSKYKEDLTKVVDKYKENGYRDARIISDTVVKNSDNTLSIKLKVEEGNKYYFGDIKFLGNSVYTDQQLNTVLGVKKGDVYNGVLMQKRIKDFTKPDANDISNMYQNHGYLFSNVNAVETKTANDSIDFEVRITEGPLAYFNKITVVGNDRTNDHVIYREIRTKPGEKYSQEDLVRTVRELSQLGFFDPESIKPDLKNVDATAGTVDVEYKLTEKGSSQVELQGGYGGGGFIGTLGLSFNNFSIKNILDKKSYQPLPLGDGQKLSLRLQASTFFQTYSFSFSEPWMGGKKPVQFSVSLSQSKTYNFTSSANSTSRSVNKNSYFNISSITVGLAKRLTVPDDYFVLSQALSYQYYDINNYRSALFAAGDGISRNFAYTIGLTRNNKGDNPVFPMRGSEFGVTLKLTPPYSLFNGVDYANLKNDPAYQDANGVPSQSLIDQKRFNWLEFYKIKFKGDWYTKVYDKLVLRTLGEFGFIGSYNSARGLIPFERFFLGGSGMMMYSMDGREMVQLRGYDDTTLSPKDGGALYNKFSMELRYPITLKPAASIFALTFMEAGASYSSFKEYNPFALYRSAGAGLRIFMPSFGMLGMDFGYGFDKLPNATQRNGWETHFIIGQQF